MSAAIVIQGNAARVSAQLAEYLRFTRLTPAQALAKQAGKFGFLLAGKLRQFSPTKGAVKSAMLARLKGGNGVKVRESVVASIMRKHGAASDVGTRKTIFRRGKKMVGSFLRKKRRLNLRALMVERELNLRERGRGWLPFGARMNLRGIQPGGTVTHRGRYRQQLGTAELQADTSGNTALQMLFGSPTSELGDVLGMSRFRAVVDASLTDLSVDLQQYLDRKYAEQAAKGGTA